MRNGIYSIIMQRCRIHAMTPFTVPGNASGHRCFFGTTIITMYTDYNYTTGIISMGVKPVVGTELLAPAKLIFNTPDVGLAQVHPNYNYT